MTTAAAATDSTASDVAEDFVPEPLAPESVAAEPGAAPVTPEPVTPEPVTPEPVTPEPKPAAEVPEIMTEAPETAEPVITGMDVSFEANPDLVEDAFEVTAGSPPPSPPDLAPPRTGVTTEPPAPPLGDSLEAASRAAAEHDSVEAPPAAPGIDIPQPQPSSEPAGSVVEQTAADTAAAARVEEGPTIHLPERDTERTVRAEIPKPIGAARDPIDTPLPRPIGHDGPAISESAPATKPRVAVPEPRPRPAPRSADDLPPIDGRRFQNPGLLGQMLQLALIATAAIAVAMMVGLILLNNRLDAYATSGEGLNRIESAESLINTWLRPLLAVAVLGVYVFLVFWARRVTRNLSFFDRGVPETALWMWVIPLVNVFMLFRHLDLAWKGSDVLHRSSGWRKGRPDLWNLGFAILVVVGFGLIIYGFWLGADTFEAAIDANAFSMIGYALLAASLLCAAKAVGNVIHRQRTRAESFA